MRHIPGPPEQLAELVFLPCFHKRTEQEYCVLEENTSVETIHGTMTGRKGDCLVRGVTGQLYVLTAESFRNAYDQVDV